MLEEKDKYYTPEIEEFHVGFEYELYTLNGSPERIWSKFEFKYAEDDYPDIDMLQYVQNRIKQGVCRVKCLSQEDIESLGFKKSNIRIISWINKDGIGVQLWGGEVLLFTKFGMYDREEQVFKGRIKNKSELKRVLQQIGYDRQDN
jgi:hypothetical protein